MVFMMDSRRAADIAQAAGLDTGLHLNLDLPLDGPGLPPELRERLSRVIRYFRFGRWPQILYNPLIQKDVAYAVRAQCEEYSRLYGAAPNRVDGHHHLHLSANVLLAGLLPQGLRLRRSFTFLPREKSFLNRLYRRQVDRRVTRRHVCTDAFFSIRPLDDLPRLTRIMALAQASDVELMVHPDAPDEVAFLLGARFADLVADVPRGTYRQLGLARGGPGISTSAQT